MTASASLDHLADWTRDFPAGPRMPVLFVGHGSPMNAIEDNPFSRTWRSVGEALPPPRAILCISAHWETRGARVTTVPKPRTIHDFGGFPRPLYEVQYPAPGSPTLAEATIEVAEGEVAGDVEWGLDHGAWSILAHMFPAADVPVVQLSLDRGLDSRGHLDLARRLAVLRRRGVLVVGSGNIVHHLGMVDFRHPGGFDWAEEARRAFVERIAEGDERSLADWASLGRPAQLAVPTAEHFLPLLYPLAMREADERATFFNDRSVLGSIAMTGVLWDGEAGAG